MKIRSNEDPKTKLTNFHLFAFAMPSFATALLYGPITTVIPTIYAKYYAMDLAFIGMVLMITRIFDAVTDPAIGYLSDRIRTPFGQRKPWIVAGFMLTVIAIYQLFVPPENVQPMFFMVWFLLLYLFLTVAEIPYSAWQSEITRDYKTRSKVSAYRWIFLSGGGVLFAASPLLPIFPTNEMTPAVLKIMAVIIVVLLPVSTLIAVFFAPQGKPVKVKKAGSVWSLLQDFYQNKPFLLFIVSFMFGGLAAGMQTVLAFLYFDTYLGLGHRFPEILIVMSAAQLFSIPVWLHLINRYNKHQVFAVGRILAVTVSLGILFLKPGPSVFPLFIAIWCGVMFFAGAQVISPAILGDIIDYDVLKSRRNQAGQYNAVFTLALKFNYGFGGGLAFFIIDRFGYDAAAAIHDRTSIIGMWIALAILPSIFNLISGITMFWYPIDERRQAIIRRRIESRSKSLEV